MKCIFLLLVLITCYVNQVHSQNKQSSKIMKNTLRNIQKILKHVNEFSRNLRELKKVLNQIKKNRLSKNIVPTQTSTKDKAVISKTTVMTSKTSTNCTQSSCKPKGIPKTEEYKNKTGKAVPVYSSMIYTVNYNRYGNEKSREKRCSMDPSCSAISAQNPLIKKYNGSEDYLKDVKIEGIIVKGCGNKHFLFGTGNKLTVVSTSAFCCKFGFIPVAITSLADLICLNSLYKLHYAKKTGLKSDVFLVTAYDIMLDGVFWDCDIGKAVSNDLWAPLQPDNFMSMSICAALQLSLDDKEVGYDDRICGGKAQLLCQYNP